MARLLAKLSTTGRREAVAIVPDSELAGHLFLRSFGWEAVLVRRGFFDGADGYEFRFQVEG